MNNKECTLAVGCERAGVCYAASHGHPEQCGKVDGDPVLTAFRAEMSALTVGQAQALYRDDPMRQHHEIRTEDRRDVLLREALQLLDNTEPPMRDRFIDHRQKYFQVRYNIREYLGKK